MTGFDSKRQAAQDKLVAFNNTRHAKLMVRFKENAEAMKALAQAEPVLLECVTCGTVYADGVPPQVPVQERITPPQRQWVGLEIEEVQDSYNSDYQAQTRAVEKLLKERNT